MGNRIKVPGMIMTTKYSFNNERVLDREVEFYSGATSNTAIKDDLAA